MTTRKESRCDRQNNFFDICKECRNSYGCCNDTTPPITPGRKKIIENHLKNKSIIMDEPLTRIEYTFPRLSTNKYCIFHDQKTRRCVIHPVKPETCVAGPITFDINVKTSRIEWYMKMKAICQLADMIYGHKELLKRHLASARHEIIQLVKELDSGDLKAILKKPEPKTFKIAEEDVDRSVIEKLTN